MSVTLTARSRAFLVLLVAALVVTTGFAAFAGGGSDRSPAGPSADSGDEAAAQHGDEPEIGTALKMVRNDDGSITVTES